MENSDVQYRANNILWNVHANDGEKKLAKDLGYNFKITKWDKIKLVLGCLLIIPIFINWGSKNGFFQARKKIIAQKTNRRLEKELKKELEKLEKATPEEKEKLEEKFLHTVDWCNMITKKSEMQGNNCTYQIPCIQQKRIFFIKKAKNSILAQSEVCRAVLIRYLLKEHSTKYFCLQKNNLYYVASKGVKNAQQASLAKYVDTIGTTYNEFLLREENKNLLKQYIKIQEANLLLGNMDAHNNNIIVKQAKNGELKLVVIDFDNSFSHTGLLNYQYRMMEYIDSNCLERKSEVEGYIQDAKAEIVEKLRDVNRLKEIENLINQKLGINKSPTITSYQDFSKYHIKIMNPETNWGKQVLIVNHEMIEYLKGQDRPNAVEKYTEIQGRMKSKQLEDKEKNQR